jgi:hypothetical protein
MKPFAIDVPDKEPDADMVAEPRTAARTVPVREPEADMVAEPETTVFPVAVSVAEAEIVVEPFTPRAPEPVKVAAASIWSCDETEPAVIGSNQPSAAYPSGIHMKDNTSEPS